MTLSKYALIFAVVVLAQSCQARLLHQASTSGQMCASACSTPVFFKTIRPGQPSSYACTATTETGEVIGYQLSMGSPTCTVSVGQQTIASSDFKCICKDAGQTQGLDRPVASGSCSGSCQESIDGQTGLPLGEQDSHACMASSEMGTTNRFGHTNGSTCVWAADSVAQSSTDFSCVCLFSVGGPARAPLQQIQQQISAATAG